MLGAVPAGLDGNPAPLVTPARDAVLDRLAARIGGQALYEADADPQSAATIVIDNDDLAVPVVVREG